ncbi:MAG: hypothetical protein J5846_03200 [Desulfovibrio sp.]|nr:hypothetical protein [Desulfovibrio sp.]
MLEDFLQARARKMYFFCPPGLASAGFRDAVLDINANLLDASILLPPGILTGTQMQLSLFILDRTRSSSGQKEIAFADASSLQINDILTLVDKGDAKPARQIFLEVMDRSVRKDFRDVLLRKESILASQHCSQNVLARVLQGPHTSLADCAAIIKCPSFLQSRQGKTVELSCLSPRDFAPFGYTLPRDPEKKLFSSSRVQEDMYLKPRDIVMVAQRNVGKLCIIAPDFAEPAWTGASFTWIIRPRSCDPRVLWLYLSSKMIGDYLAGCARGSTMPMLPVKALQSIPVPDFPKKEQSAMLKAFEELEKARATLASLKSRTSALLNTFYAD